MKGVDVDPQVDWLRAPATRRRARQLRDEGIERAETGAEAENPEWSALADGFLRRWLERTDRPFQMCEVRWAAKGIVPEPREPRAWGGVANRARLAGLIVKVGTEPDLDPKSHRSPCNVWQGRR